MQLKDVRPESFVKQIRCDRCGSLCELGEVEFHEFVSIDLKAGYASIFGDGNDIQVDLCQCCLRLTLGPWLRVSGPAANQVLMQEKLNRFDPFRHGGEFPTDAAESFQKPEDLPVQERPALNASLVLSQWLVPASRLIGRSMRLFFAPLTGSIRGIRQEYRRLARIEYARRERQAEFVRRGQAAIARSEAAGDGIPAEVVFAKLRAKLDVAQKRR